MDDEFEALREQLDAGATFDDAYAEVFGDDSYASVEALEMWLDWGGSL